MSSLPSRGAVPHLPEGVTVNEPPTGTTVTHRWVEGDGVVAETSQELIHYVMDLEALVRWFALPFRYQDQEGEWHQNEPIWTVWDDHGNYLPEADRLKRTWDRVMQS